MEVIWHKAASYSSGGANVHPNTWFRGPREIQTTERATSVGRIYAMHAM